MGMIRTITGCLAAALVVAGCGSSPGTPTQSPAGSGPGSEDGEALPRHELRPGETRVGSTKLIDRRQRTGLAPDTLDRVKTTAPPPKSSTQIYKAVAPATVIVRVEAGIGSGIVIDPAGWVLTNHHVIESGKVEDFRYKATVLLGKLSNETGAMERDEKEYEAEVYKADKLRDLALLKIVKPPKNLPFVKIAKDKPVPGAGVVARGHAGAGMLWALKSGQISALGKLSEALAELASFKGDEQGEKAKKAFVEYVESKNLGMVIQSTCNILPGDSGGPLLNAAGELIGLNVFARRDTRTGGLVSFHVHLDEIRDFAKKRPKHPAQLLPDPWQEGGGDLSFQDADLDGMVDVLMMQGRQPCLFCPRQSSAVFIDADQSSYRQTSKLPDLNEVFEKRKFDAEAVYLQLENDVLIWYDTDDDGRFDAVLQDQGTTGMVSAGYRIKKSGVLERVDAWSNTKPFQVALFEDDKMHQRFARITRAAFPDRYTDAPSAIGKTLPDPLAATGWGQATDLDKDGAFDAVDVTTPFSKRLLIDADRSFVPSLGLFVEMGKVDARRMDPEIVVVSQSTHMWVFYDTDDDSRLDLVLHAPGARDYVAVDAWSLDASGKTSAAPEHLGRKLLRPQLLKQAGNATAIASMVDKGLFEIMSTKSDDLRSFPDPVADHRGTGMELLDLQQAPKSVVTLVGTGSDGYLVDLDRSSGLFLPREKIDIEKTVKDGKFDAEFAYFHRGDIAWTFYDTDLRKGYDVVLVNLDTDKPDLAAAYTIDKDGRVTLDTSLARGALVRPSLFKNPLLKKKLETIAPELFAAALVE